MKTRTNPEKSLAQAIVNLALHWLVVQDGHNLPEQVEAEFICGWTFPRLGFQPFGEDVPGTSAAT